MRKSITILLGALMLLGGQAVLAQSDPFGTLDTIALVPAVVPDPGAGQYKLRLDLYVYSDEPVAGATVGFFWDNAKVVMDSAVVAPAVKAAFELGTFVYENNNLSITNANKHFLFGGAAVGAGYPGDGSTRRLWASYYFSTPGWTASDAVTFDSLTYSAGTEYLFVETNTGGDIRPYFNGEVTIGNATPPNQPPVLGAIGPKSVNEMALLTFTVTATDPDAGDVLTLSATNLPTGATFVPATGVFSWTPTYEQAGPYNVTFAVSDGEASDDEVVAITVNNVNRPPVLATIGPKSVNENALLTFTVTATDPDGGTPTLSATNLPAGASFTPATGVFSWTPTYEQAGAYNVTFAASDGALTDNEVVAITVNNVNRPPVLAAIGPKTVDENALLTIMVSATDPDATPLTLSATNLPTGANFVDNGNGSGTFTWTPTYDQAGPYNVTFAVSDGALTDDEIVAITVNDVNGTPTLDPIEDVVVCAGSSITVTAYGANEDGPLVDMWAEPILPNMTANWAGGGELQIVFEPALDQVGSYPMTVSACDNEDTVSVEFTITVYDCSANDSGKVAVRPEPVYFFMQDAITPMAATITIGDFIGGHLPGDVDLSSITVNDTVVPVEVTIEPMYPDFSGEVVSIDVMVSEILIPYGAFYDTVIATITVDGRFMDGSVFGMSRTIRLIGHRSGDVNLDGQVNLSDVAAVVLTMFRGAPEPKGIAGADVNGRCGLNIGDVAYYITYLFRGGPAPQPPCRQ